MTVSRNNLEQRKQNLITQQEELAKQIEIIEEQEAEEAKRVFETTAVKIVCLACEGTGVFEYDPDDHADEEDCDPCRGKGYLLATPFTGKSLYNLDEDEVQEFTTNYL